MSHRDLTLALQIYVNVFLLQIIITWSKAYDAKTWILRTYRISIIKLP